MSMKPLPEAPKNAFEPPAVPFPPPPSEAAPPPPPPDNVFVAEEDNSERDGKDSHESSSGRDAIQVLVGSAGEIDEYAGGEDHPEGTPASGEAHVEGIQLMEERLGPVLVEDHVSELPGCSRIAQAVVPGSAFQLHAMQAELTPTMTAASKRELKEQHTKVDLNKINDGSVLPVTAGQVLLVRHEAALARRQLMPPNLPPALMEDLPCGSLARVTATYKETKKVASDHGDSFVDHDFPRKPSSCGGAAGEGEESTWMWRSAARERPDACFLGDRHIDSDAIVPGSASGRGFLSAVAALACASRGRSKHLLEKVLPSSASQEYLARNAEAVRENTIAEPLIFRFSFYKWGQWVNVVVDDRLPYIVGGSGHEFVCARLSAPNQFGLSLLEKAYAKLHGSYAAVQCITFFDALRDLTGTIVDISWDLREICAQKSSYRAGDQYYDPVALWRRLESAHSDDIAMVITGGDDRPAAIQAGGVEELGLFAHTAYPVMARETVTVKPAPGVTAGEDHLLYLGNKSEDSPCWTGAWSSRSGQWGAVSKGKAKSLRKVMEKDPRGFWMSWQDIIESSSLLLFLRKEKYSHCFRGQWLCSSPALQESSSAGGHTGYVSWHRNPQYLLNVKSPGEVLVSVMQQEPLLFTVGTGQAGGVGAALRIGFSLFGPLEENRSTKLHHLLNIQRPCLYRNEVEVAECCQLAVPGKYILTVTAWDPEEKGKFYLRVQSASGNCLSSCKELILDMPAKKTFAGSVKSALAVTLVSATGLQKRMLNSVHAYAEVTVDGVSKKTRPHKEGGRSPFWNERFLFFLRKSSPSKPPTDASASPIVSKSSGKLKIEVWDSNMLVDTFLGVCHLDLHEMAAAAARDWPGPTKTHSVLLNLELRKGDKELGKVASGSILFHFCYFLLPDFA